MRGAVTVGGVVTVGKGGKSQDRRRKGARWEHVAHKASSVGEV